MLLSIIENFPEGYFEGIYQGKKYGISKQLFNEGKSYKLYAEELSGTNFISLNYYKTKTKAYLKPCEMPEQKVIDFLENVKILK